jgi:ABC-2 type transport system ATP-binding protein
MSKVPLLEFRDIKKRFGKNDILNGVSFAINENEIFGLLGKSGSGKTTLLHILLGLYTPEDGSIFYKGQPITRKNNILKQITGFATQHNSFHLKLTVNENLKYYGKMYGIRGTTLTTRITNLLRLMKLTRAKDSLAQNLSGGMKRRLDVAISLIHDPEIIVLDEPTTGLDIVLSNNFWEMIKQVHKAGKTVIVSTHILTAVERNCTNLGLLHEGLFYTSNTLNSFAKKHKTNSLEKIFMKLYKNDNKNIS